MKNTKHTQLWKLSTIILSAALMVIAAGCSKAAAAEKLLPYKNPKLSAQVRTEDLLGRMTLEEKVAQLSGKGLSGSEYGDKNAKTFGTVSNERLGIPGFIMGHGITGVRVGRDKNTYSTYFCTPKAIGSAWDTDLYYRLGVAIAKELRAYQQDLNLGPTLNIIRHPYGGRNWECYSEDPYLISELAVQYTKASQENGVISGPKHFAANNQEKNRFDINNVVDERTMNEIYLPAFKAAVQRGGAMNIMGAYDRLNGQFCCSNKELLTTILRDKWGFKGFVLSDFSKAVRSTVDCPNAGCDIEMDGTKFYGEKLVQAVKDGQVSQETIDQMVRRVLFTKFTFGMFEPRPVVPKSVIHCKEHQAIAMEVAQKKSIVLLKNKNNVLPLNKKKIKSIAIIGPNAKKWTKPSDKNDHTYYLQGGGSGHCYFFPDALVSPFDGITQKLGKDAKVNYAQGCTPPDKEKHTKKENKLLIEEAVKTASQSDLVILVAGISGFREAEARDRTEVTLPAEQEELIAAVTKANPNTIVVVAAGDYIDMQKWINDTPAVLMAFYCGEKIGNGIADIIFGDVNPSGKLPITFPVSVSQYPKSSYFPGGPYSKENKSNVYAEGVFVGYRYFDTNKEEVAFPFGYGLSYTTFKYDNMKISDDKSDETVTISVDITNSGKVKGDEIVQLYVSDIKASVDRPTKELKGFARISLDPGQKKTVSFDLKNDAFSFYSVEKHDFLVEPGQFEILIGSSSRDIKLKKILEKI